MSWSDDDQDKMLAWKAAQADRCPGCGNWLDECTDGELADAWQATSRRCFACEASALEAKRFGGPDGSTAGLLVSARLLRPT